MTQSFSSASNHFFATKETDIYYEKELTFKHLNNKEISNDFMKLLKNPDFYDIKITAGMDDDCETFNAHSTILRARSSYFNAALSDKWACGGIITFKKQNISPKIFKIILEYIYGGNIEMDLYPKEIFDLIVAFDELNISQVTDILQEFLINNSEEWIQKNIIRVHDISLKNISFVGFHDYCAQVISCCPKIFFQSNDFNIAEKPSLISILQQKDLSIEEIEIWSFILQWGITQDVELNKDVTKWNDNDFIKLKGQLHDLIPLIRFDQISDDDFYNKVKPFEKIFDKDVRNIQTNPRPDVPQTSLKIKLLNLHSQCHIANWIKRKDCVYDNNTVPYEFKLILRGSDDKFTKSTFNKMCYNLKRTVVVMKIKNTGEIIGGYNPVYWNKKKYSDKENYWIETSDSFIFKIDKYHLENSIICRVKSSRTAIFNLSRGIVIFGIHIRISNQKKKTKASIPVKSFVNFNDLSIVSSGDNKASCYYNNGNNSYSGNLNLKKNSDILQELEEYEVYQLVKKNH